MQDLEEINGKSAILASECFSFCSTIERVLVSLASSSYNLQLSLEGFVAECEAERMDAGDLWVLFKRKGRMEMVIDK